MTVLLVVIILVFLILAHEFGHFLSAKLFGVRVEEFGIGFPPRALLFGKIGETEYTLNWIPFGGFVRLFGEQEDSSEHGKGSFKDAARWKQAVILLAGVAMNAIVAWVLFAVALSIGVPQAVAQVPPGESGQVYVSNIIPGSPAAAAGIVAGDQITSVQDQAGTMPIDPLTPESLSAYIASHGGQAITLTYLHGGVKERATVIPADGVDPGEAGRPAIGVGLALVATQAVSPSEAIVGAFSVTGNSFVIVAQGLWGIVEGVVRGSLDLSGLEGPVGLVSQVGQAAQTGIGEVLELAAFISVNLTIVNLIPIPALDGGRLLMLAVEATTRRSAPRLAFEILNTIGVALIILLMVAVTYHDIIQLVSSASM